MKSTIKSAKIAVVIALLLTLTAACAKKDFDELPAGQVVFYVADIPSSQGPEEIAMAAPEVIVYGNGRVLKLRDREPGHIPKYDMYIAKPEVVAEFAYEAGQSDVFRSGVDFGEPMDSANHATRRVGLRGTGEPITVSFKRPERSSDVTVSSDAAANRKSMREWVERALHLGIQVEETHNAEWGSIRVYAPGVPAGKDVNLGQLPAWPGPKINSGCIEFSGDEAQKVVAAAFKNHSNYWQVDGKPLMLIVNSSPLDLGLQSCRKIN